MLQTRRLDLERPNPVPGGDDHIVSPALVPEVAVLVLAAREDEDGYFWYEGRADDVIISAGYRIGPFEVESACLEHPAVAEAAAVASPDDRRGNVVKAFVVAAGGYEPTEQLA